jgi:hypothetical protein
MHAARLLTVVAAAVLAVQTASASPVYSRYRGVSIGDPVGAVVTALDMTARDVVVVHTRPSLIQQLTWRPNQYFAGRTGKAEAMAEMVLTFHLGRLTRIVATYDRDRTEGLTNADLQDSFTATYGPSMLIPTAIATGPGPGTAAVGEPQIIGQWGDGETLVVLWREVYPPRVKLTVSSVTANRLMEDALASSVRLDALEAPTREVIRRVSDAHTQRQRAEQSRVDNKAAFTP